MWWITARLPAAIVRRVNTEVTALLARPDLRERILSTGNEPAPTSEEEFARYIANSVPRWVKMARDPGQTFD